MRIPLPLSIEQGDGVEDDASSEPSTESFLFFLALMLVDFPVGLDGAGIPVMGLESMAAVTVEGRGSGDGGGASIDQEMRTVGAQNKTRGGAAEVF